MTLKAWEVEGRNGTIYDLNSDRKKDLKKTINTKSGFLNLVYLKLSEDFENVKNNFVPVSEKSMHNIRLLSNFLLVYKDVKIGIYTDKRGHKKNRFVCVGADIFNF